MSETTPPLAEARVVASDEASTAPLEASTARLGIARLETSTARLRTTRLAASTARVEAARHEGLLPTGCTGDCGDECPDGGCPEGCPGCASDGLGTSAAAMPVSASGWPEPATTTPRATAPGFYDESLAASGVRADVFRPPRA